MTTVKRNQYQSLATTDIYEDRDQISWKLPCIILVPIVICATIVGHILTVAHFGTPTHSSTNFSPIDGPTERDVAAAQAFADKQFEEELRKPCEEAEKFYNNTFKRKHNSDPAPPKPPNDGCVATIMIFRHCEDGSAREHCGYMGRLRSQYIATLFGNDANDRWPAPSYIFATNAGERHNKFVNNWREIETVEALSKKVNVTIDETFGYPERDEFVKHLYDMLRNGDMCGKLAVISWKHHNIPHFTHSMGCGPENGCPMTFSEQDYESVWQLTYSYHKQIYPPYVVEDTTKHGLKKQEASWGQYPEWFVYGTVQNEGFDPLAFAKANGAF